MSAILGSTPIGTILMTVISFLLVIYIVYRFAWLPISKVLAERQTLITKKLDDAEAARIASQNEIEEAKKKVEKSLQHAQELVNGAKAHGEEIADKLIHEARQDSEDLRKKTEADLLRERRKFHEDMEGSVVRISVMMAQKVLEREISEADHREFIHEYIKRLDAEVK